MVDFIKSFRTGVHAAQTAEENKAEINAVFDELNAQLATVTENKVRILPLQFQEHFSWHNLSKKEIFEPYWGIGVVRTSGGEATEIARWSVSETGYPCAISSSSGKFMCSDRKGLESALAMLLQHASVGQTILEMLSPPTSAEPAP
ncbi:hypothetical protein [Bordetella genomosp. 5]|uniref:hypothetical protein n=1 Tax=Bordetella genomosp. 5 TaxID=1395608 RepID=UPI00114049B9|nr:hypothetical protein [Bordetella genomosp. 5]